MDRMFREVVWYVFLNQILLFERYGVEGVYAVRVSALKQTQMCYPLHCSALLALLVLLLLPVDGRFSAAFVKDGFILLGPLFFS